LWTRHNWPGNIRELRSAIQSSVLMTTGPILLPEHLPETVTRQRSPAVSDSATGAPADWEQMVADDLREGRTGIYARAVEKMERFLLTKVLQATNGHQTRASELLGITRGSLRHKLRTL